MTSVKNPHLRVSFNLMKTTPLISHLDPHPSVQGDTSGYEKVARTMHRFSSQSDASAATMDPESVIVQDAEEPKEAKRSQHG
jgi:hypothetical protein